MEERERCRSNSPGLAESKQGGSCSRFGPSAKLGEKIKKLAPWRINQSAIEFLEGDCEFHGGNATVSRAFLGVPLGKDDSIATESEHIADGSLDSDHQTSKSKDHIHQPIDHEREQQGTSRDSNREKYGGKRRDERLGRGSGGESEGRKVIAVKKLRIGDDTDLERVLALALREAELLVGLSHSNVIRLEGFVEDVSKDVIWLIFPWESKGNLRDFLASQEWEIPERISLIFDVAEGLEYLHSREPPICHGDLKSVNLLVNSRYCAVITDFGSARRLKNKYPDGRFKHDEPTLPLAPPLQATFFAPTNTITLTGNKYTLRWAAPELLMDDQPTLWSDIWALGWICYEAMTNTIPFQDVSADVIVVERVIQGDLPSVTDDTRMSLIRELCTLMMTCWNHSPTERPTAKNCRQSISWMPMVFPNPTRATGTAVPRTLSPELLIKLGYMYQWEHGYLNGSNLFTQALQISTDTGDQHGRVHAMCGLAQAHLHRNDSSEAITLYSEALKITTNLDNIEAKARVIWGLAEAHRVRHEYEEAIAHYSEALKMWTDNDNKSGRATALWGLADVRRLRGDYSEAIELYSDALQTCSDIGNTKGKANALWGLAQVHFHRNEYSDASRLYSQALQAFNDIGEENGRAASLFGLAEIRRLRKDYSDATKFYSEVIDIRAETGDRQGRAVALWGLAEVHRLQGDYSDSVGLYSMALQICTDIGDQAGKAAILRNLAEVYRRQSHLSDALSYYNQAASIFEKLGDIKATEDALRHAADVQRSLDRVGA